MERGMQPSSSELTGSCSLISCSFTNLEPRVCACRLPADLFVTHCGVGPTVMGVYERPTISW